MPHPHERQTLSHVLIIDDHPAQPSTIHDIVVAEGFHPILCQSPTEALHALEQHDIGIAVVDLDLTDMDEAHFLNQLRIHNNQIRIIIYTEQGSLASAKTAIAAGAFAYLEKTDGSQDFVHHLHRAKKALLNDQATRQEQPLQEGTDGLLEWNTQEPLETLEHQRAKEREASFGRMFDQSLNEFYIVHANTLRFLNVNRGALENIGYTLEELQHMSPSDITFGMNQEALQNFLAPLHTQESAIVHCETIHHRKNGSRYPVDIHVQLSTFESTPVYIMTGLDITERKKEEESLANLVAGTASVAAEQFFPQLVKHLATALEVNFAAVTELCGPDKVSTLAVWQANTPAEHMVYELPDTPCEQVFKQSPAVYPRNVQATFPKDSYLQTLQAECYLGVALTNSKGEPLGHLSIIDTKPYKKTERAVSILKIFAARASAELLRQKTELEKAQRESLLTLMLNTGPGCIKRVAGDGTLLSMNPAGLALIEARNEDEALGLSVFDLVVPEHRPAFEQMHQQVMEGDTQTLQFKIEGLNGTRRWMETYAVPFQNPITNQVEHLAVTHDITDRKAAEEASQRSEQAYRELYHNNPTMYFTVSRKGIIQSVNQFGLDQLGHAESELIGAPVLNIFHGGDRFEVQKHFDRCLNEPSQLHHWEFRKVKKNGDLIWVKETARVIQDSEGHSLVLIVCEDITIQKQAELALKKSEERFRRLFEDAPMGICLVGPGGVIHQSNPAMSALTGYSEHEIIGQTYALYTHPDDLPKNLDLTTQLFQGERTSYEINKRYLCKSGEVKWVKVFVSSIHGAGPSEPTAVAIIEDITEQKQYEEALTEMNLALVHAMPGISQIDDSGCYLYVNENYASLLGQEPSELLGKSWEPTVHPDDLPLAFQAYENTIQTGKGEFEARAIRKNGSMFYKQVLMVKADPLKNPGVSHHCFMRDITDRKEVEEALREQQTFLRQILDINPNFVFAKDRNGRFTLINQAVADVYGTTVDNLIGKTDTAFNPNLKEVEFFRQKDLEVMDSGEDQFILEEKITDAEGKERWLQTVKRPLLDKNGLPSQMLGVSTDITHRKEIEKALQTSEQSIRELYEITSAQDATFDHKIRSLLKLGCQRFGLPIATLTKRIEDNLELEFLHAPDNTWSEHSLVPICDSFCGIALKRSEPLLFEDVGKTEWKNSSAYQALGLKAYIGTKVMVGSQVYGSLCFLDRQPRQGKYTPSDIHFLQLMARWIGGELERKHAEEALQVANDRLRTLSQQLLTVQENERRQLARDLHDEIGQTLTAVKINLQTLDQGKSFARSKGLLHDSMQILDSMLKHVRELSLDLRPSLLDDLGLVAAARWFVNRQGERAGWTVKIDIDDTMPQLPSDQATACFRVIQEALTNVMRHAQASHVNVQLHLIDNLLDLLIEDNGIGFDSIQVLEQAASGQTLGVLSMQERVRFLNGHLTIVSQRKQGTQIRARIPITASVKENTTC